MDRLKNKVALISGGGAGIGAAAARCMAQEGARVAIADIADASGEAVAEAIVRECGEAFFIHLDVTREEDWIAAVDATVSRFGGVDVLVNNAGLYLGKGSEEASIPEWHKICAVNLTGVVLGTKLALGSLRERARSSPQGSAIINMSSIAGLKGSAVDPLYSMTKGGVTTFTKSTAIEFGRKGYRIRVNSVHPHSVQTDMTIGHFVDKAGTGDPAAIDAYRKSAAASLPIQRLAVPEDIAGAVVFLASDESGFMTGSSLIVDGGATA